MKSDFLCFVYRQGFIERWNRMDNKTATDIHLHSHCFSVSIISFLLAEIDNHLFGAKHNTDRIGMEGLMHEKSEGVLSDLPSPVKYATELLKTEFKRIENDVEEICVNSLPDFLKVRLRSYIVQKDVAAEHKAIIKAADDIVAWHKCLEEVERADNDDFIDALENLKSKVDKHEAAMPCVNWFLNNFNVGYQKTIDALMEDNAEMIDRDKHELTAVRDNKVSVISG